MISYYSAVFVAALLLLGLLQYAVRNGSRNQKMLVFKVVSLTTAIAFLLPTLLNTFTLLQTGLLMAVLAALGGAFVPVAELLPINETVSENEVPIVMKETVSEDETSEVEMTMEVDQEVFEDAIPVVLGTEIPEEPGVEEMPDQDELLSEKVQDKETIVHEEVVTEEIMSEEVESEEVEDVEIVYDEMTTEEAMTEEVEIEEMTTEEVEIEEKTTEEVAMEEIECDKILMDSLEEQVVEEVSGGIILPDTFSETMAEIMLMNGYLALKEEEEEEAIDSFKMVCQRAQVTDQCMMAYMELKLLLPEAGRMTELIYMSDGLLDGKNELTTLQAGYIEKHTHYLKRLVSLLNAHGIPVELPYSAMQDELKEMAMTHQK